MIFWIVSDVFTKRLDVYPDDRPVQSIDVQPGQTTVSIAKPAPTWTMLEVRGFQDMEPVSRYLTVVYLSERLPKSIEDASGG